MNKPPVTIAQKSAYMQGKRGKRARRVHKTAELTATDLRCEGLREPLQVDTLIPRFSWRIEVSAAETRSVRQSSCQLRIVEVDALGRALSQALESPRIETGDSQWVEIPGFSPKARTAYSWQVRIWDGHGQSSDWSEPAHFGTGLLGGKWPAEWIGDGRNLLPSQTAPARYFRGVFRVRQLPVRARLYVSALGLVEPWMNGRQVTDDKFVPGWPDYRQRVFYVAFDVTALLRVGDNTIGLILGDGWYSGTLIPGHQFGQEAMVSAFIDLTDANGYVTTFTTGEDWRWSDSGPITLNSLYDGERYDARRELTDWSDAASVGDGENWQPARKRIGWYGLGLPLTYTARISPPVRRIESIQPKSVRRLGPQVHVFDLGQNFAGWVRLRVQAAPGQEINLRFAEMLEPDGSIHTDNLRKAKATAVYVTKGVGIEEWEPRFTYFGFRYVELKGIEEPLADAVTGIVLYADLGKTGQFECSDPLLNQLWRNTLWGQKSNFLEVPTDCPQRDERVGWTGDAQIFASAALFNMDAGNFFRQWMFSVRDGFRNDPQGGFPDVAPDTGFFHGSAGWAEAGIIVPWTVWLHTGDRRVLSESIGAIQNALELMASQAPDGIRRSPPTYGDWLAPGFEYGKFCPRYDLIATAYLAYAADLALRIADILGRPELADCNRVLRDRVRAAFQREFIGADGRAVDDVQTSYVLILAFDLVEPALRDQVAAHLVRAVAEKGDHLATGFLGTPLLTPVLSAIGRADLAYAVLLKTTYPGWLFTVKNGATTVWERWDSWTPEGGFHKDGMNSYNHYAYGSVVRWFYDTIAGLQPLPMSPGWKRFRVAPQPGGRLEHASAIVQTPYGEASSAWRIKRGRFHLTVGIPPNTEAEVVIGALNTDAVLLDGVVLSRHGFATSTVAPDGHHVVSLGSGKYELVFAAKAGSAASRSRNKLPMKVRAPTC